MIMHDAIAATELARYSEQVRLDSIKSPEERNRLGQFATPNRLALEIANHALDLWKGRTDLVRFLDPSVGSGSFYSALRQVFPDELIAGASGVELDPLFAAAASSLWGPEGLVVTTADFSELQPPGVGHRYNLVLANPPYVRHHHMTQDEKQRLKDLVRRRLDIDVSGLAGLYTYFLLLCNDWLSDGGISAWLIPSEFMDVNYGAAIKQYLASHVTLLHIHRFCPSDEQFLDALVTSTLVFFRKSPPPAGHAAKMSFGGPLHHPKAIKSVPLDDLRSARKWTIFPSSRPVVTTGDAETSTLGDLFTIRRGQATGSNTFFILPRQEALRRGIPGSFLKPILPSPKYLKTSVVEADDDGYPVVEIPLAIIDCDRPEVELRADHPEFWNYLEGGIKQGIDRGYLASRRAPWYSQERRDPPPFVCTYMGRQRGDRSPFRMIRNKSRATATNVYLLLYPKGLLKRALDAEPELHQIVSSLLQDIKAEHFIDEGRVYGGGLRKMEPKELANLPAGSIVRAVGLSFAARQTTLQF